LTVWEDEETGEVHWHKTEYQDLIKKIFTMERQINQLEQKVKKLSGERNG
jgi:quinol monooxygenase YgiN